MPVNKIFTNDKCVGCNLCITNCPCDEANVAVIENGKNKILVDPDKCIVCGECVRNCTHDARDYVDDTETFFRDLRAGKQIAVIVAPAVRTNFPDYERLLGFFRSSGASGLYDTSFGADICVWGYLRYLAKHTNEKGLIAQPCPVIVNFIERYTPELLEKLSPVHSPAMCMAVYMKKYKRIPGSYAFISPCIAKRDEFFDENTGLLVDYNITFRKLMDYLQRNRLDYRNASPDHYDNEQHGLGAVFPMPGGLRVNVEQYVDDAWIHQVEGQPHASHFLRDFPRGNSEDLPFLVDILNCQHGCNIGTGALRTENETLAVDSELQKIKKKTKATRRRKNQIPGPDFKKFDKELNLEDFTRHYHNKNVQSIPVSPTELENAFLMLHKRTEEERHVDCRSCGYSSCRNMAEAVAKGINHKENCVEYFKSVLRDQSAENETLAAEREQQTATLRQGVESILSGILDSNRHTDITKNDVESIHDQIGHMSDISSRLKSNVSQLQTEINKYSEMSAEIVNISRQTNILALNASVEAAQAGQLGKGFAVVAEQIKRLSDQSQKSAKDAVQNNEVVAPLLQILSEVSDEVLDESKIIADNANNIQNSVEELSRIQQNIANDAERIASADQTMGA